MNEYVIGIDQSTQGTKVMLFDASGKMIRRIAREHRQLIDERGWVEHDPEEIYQNLLILIREILDSIGNQPYRIVTVGITNQRETAMAWYRRTGKPVWNAIVWQCARGETICERIRTAGSDKMIYERTGLNLSPYFTAAKLAWIMENIPGIREQAEQGGICCGTMDSYLVWRLTKGDSFRTDASNASRTQLMDIRKQAWDNDICSVFGVPMVCLPEISDSDMNYGMTDFEGMLSEPVSIHAVMGDSHAALFGQGCLTEGKMKATYGTGSSIMMNTGEQICFSKGGLVTSIGWRMSGKTCYVLEGNINYAGAVITWLKNDLEILQSAEESERCAQEANPSDSTYLVPAFSGLGAPYWCSNASAILIGMKRTTGRKEIIKAGLESIAYQIADIVRIMRNDTNNDHIELRVDGGPTQNHWLMRFQSDILNCKVMVPDVQELSGIGVAYAAGIGSGYYTKEIFELIQYKEWMPEMEQSKRCAKLSGWDHAVRMIVNG